MLMTFSFIIIIVVATITGYTLKALSRSGAIATIIIGAATLLGFGVKGLILMGVFFVSSSFWSEYKRDKKRTSEEINEKSGARDAIQVLANGGLPASISILYFYLQSDYLLFMFITSLAAANSDTWASEIGSSSNGKPIHILSFKKVEAGTSGAISILGTCAAFLGSLLIAIVSINFWDDVSLQVALLLALSGFLGNLVDTILGATIQASYSCQVCQLITEKIKHCEQKTKLKRGLPFFNNDVVNFLSILIGSLLVLVLI